MTDKHSENWFSVDVGAFDAPEIINDEEKSDEIIRDIRQYEKETEWDEDGDPDDAVDERAPESPTEAELRHHQSRLERGLESFDFSDMGRFGTLKENKINAESWTKRPAKQILHSMTLFIVLLFVYSHMFVF